MNISYNVIPADNSQKIESLLTEIHPEIIICDVMMPGIDGITLTKEIKTSKKTSWTRSYRHSL